LLHGIPSLELGQLRAFAIIRAVVVLPTPLGPVSIYPCATRSFLKAFK